MEENKIVSNSTIGSKIRVLFLTFNDILTFKKKKIYLFNFLRTKFSYKIGCSLRLQPYSISFYLM